MVQLVDHAIDVLRQMSAEAGDHTSSAGSGTIRILSIEAQAAERDLVRQTLLQSASDVEVTEMADAAGASALMGAQTFDLVVMGWRASGDSGTIVRALRQAATSAGAARTPIVVLSDSDAVGPEALAAGADLHLVRPLTAAGLLNAALMRLSRKAA
jgi:DNA-binding response OmpR family regulator